MSLNDVDQRTAEWYKQRMGSATASRFCDILARSKPDKAGKTYVLKAREDYLWDLVTERLYQVPKEGPTSRALEWGTDAEPFAVTAYEIETGSSVKASPFVKHKKIPFCGASPDGLIGVDGGCEIKCPKDPKVHVQTWHSGMPESHMPQVQGNMWVTGRAWWDYISYDPRPEANPDLRLYIQRIKRDDAYIAMLEKEVKLFLAEVRVMEKDILLKLNRKEAA